MYVGRLGSGGPRLVGLTGSAVRVSDSFLEISHRVESCSGKKVGYDLRVFVRGD